MLLVKKKSIISPSQRKPPLQRKTMDRQWRSLQPVSYTHLGKEALAAEGTASPVMNIVILGISGICMGASVLMSEFYGAGQKEKLKREMSTTVIFGCYFSVIIAILGGFFSESLLGALGVPDELSLIHI